LVLGGPSMIIEESGLIIKTLAAEAN